MRKKGDPAVFNISLEDVNSEFGINFESDDLEINTSLTEGQSPVTIVNYENVVHKPQINGTTLIGDKSFEDLGLIIEEELDESSTNLVENQAIAKAINSLEAQMPKVEAKTTSEWNNMIGYIPEKDTIIIYSDYQSIQKEEGGEIVNVAVPGIKVADGQAYVQDLPFIDEQLRDIVVDHVNDIARHTTLAEKLFWSNKLNVDDSHEVDDETLIINRS